VVGISFAEMISGVSRSFALTVNEARAAREAMGVAALAARKAGLANMMEDMFFEGCKWNSKQVEVYAERLAKAG
jgi:hypothetical protein